MAFVDATREHLELRYGYGSVMMETRNPGCTGAGSVDGSNLDVPRTGSSASTLWGGRVQTTLLASDRRGSLRVRSRAKAGRMLAGGFLTAIDAA